WRSGRLATVRRWIDWFDVRGSIDRDPVVALVGAFMLALVGEAERALRLISAVDGSVHGGVLADGSTTVEGFAAIVRAAMCREGVKRMGLDARRALEMTPEASPFRSVAMLMSGVSSVMAGDEVAADAEFADAAEVGGRLGVGGDVH